MPQHYSPYKVAETFNPLASLGAGPRRSRRRQGARRLSAVDTGYFRRRFDPALKKPAFADNFPDLNAYFLRLIPTMKVRGQRPFRHHAPERFLLGASVKSAKPCRREGLGAGFAGHLNGDPENLRRTFDAYRTRLDGKRPILAPGAFAADSEEQARGASAICASSRSSCRTARP